MKSVIHPTALVSSNVKLGNNVTVGPYAVIGEHVELGDGCQIGAHAVIQPRVRLGRRNVVHPGAVIGGLPQDLSFNPETESWVETGDDNVFREGVTVSRATRPGGATTLGHHCYLMANAHVGHDCRVGDHVIFANSVALGGHVQVGDRVFFGGGAVVHQFCRVGSYAILQGVAGVTKDILPFMMAAKCPARHYRLNLIGLRRAGIDGDRLKAVSTAVRRLRRGESLEGLPTTPELEYFVNWLNGETKRGRAAFHGLDAE